MKRSLLLFLIQISSSVAFFIATVIVARYLGPEHFGDFSAAYSVASVAYIICLLGADVTAVNIISMSFKAHQNGVIKAFTIYVFTVVVLLSLVYVVIAIVSFWVAKDILLLKEIHPVFVAVIFIPFMALAFFFYRVFISLFQPMLANILYKIIINFSMLLLAMLMFVSEIFRNSYMAVILFMLPWCFAFFIMLVLLVKKVKLFSVKSERIDYKRWLNSGLSGLPYTLVLFTIPYLAIIGAEVFLANEDSVGIFATAASFSQLVANNFIACIQSLTLAPIALAIYQNSMQEVRSIFNKNLIVMGAISLLLILITYIFGEDILLLYGKKYVVGHNILLIFMIAQSVILTGCLAAPTLLYMGKNKIVATSSISLVFLIVITVSIFGYTFQELGIAFAMLLSVAIVFVAQSLYAYKLTFES